MRNPDPPQPEPDRRALGRWLRRAMVAGLGWLGLGAAGTVLVAWAGVLSSPRYTELGLVRDDTVPIWQVERAGDRLRTSVRYWHMQISGLSLMIPISDFEARAFDLDDLPRRLRPASLADLRMLAWFQDFGFPFRALRCEIHWEAQRSNVVTYRAEDGIVLPDFANGEARALPLMPIPLGFLLDAVVYAVAGRGMVELARRSRRWLRARRGRCSRCGYDLSGLPPGRACPECGRPISARRRLAPVSLHSQTGSVSSGPAP